MNPPIEGKQIAEVLDSQTVQRIYEDGVSKPVKEAGELANDTVKALRLLLAPIQIAAGFQDRLEKWINRVIRDIPEENIQPVPSRIGGPIIDGLRYLEDGDDIAEMYLNLLKKAMDKTKIDLAHPAFPQLIGALSPDEALILHCLGQKPFEEHYENDLDRKANRFYNKRIVYQEFPINDLTYPNNFYLYTSHLMALNLVSFPVYKQEPTWAEDGKREQKGEKGFARLLLTDFGQMFVSACQPKEAA